MNMNKKPNILLIDNYDSFTYNLYQMLLGLKANLSVVLNDKITKSDLTDIDGIVISPGPGKPEDAGQCLEILNSMVGKIPVLGICLGHQCIVKHFGGSVVKAENINHGKQSDIYHDGKLLFRNLPTPLTVGRYHSLIVLESNLPADLIITSYTRDAEIMGVRHKNSLTFGLQFHPESILTPQGNKILSSFVEIVNSSKR